MAQTMLERTTMSNYRFTSTYYFYNLVFFLSEYEYLTNQMRIAAGKLNLMPHKTPSGNTIFSAADIEGHLGQVLLIFFFLLAFFFLWQYLILNSIRMASFTLLISQEPFLHLKQTQSNVHKDFGFLVINNWTTG